MAPSAAKLLLACAVPLLYSAQAKPKKQHQPETTTIYTTMTLDGELHAATAAPTASKAVAAGCGNEPPLLPLYFFESGNKLRSYTFHVPDNYDKNKQYPAVIGFHGSSQFGSAFAADTGLSSGNYSGDKIMIYPNGADGNWAGPSYASVSVSEDLQFVSDLLTDIQNIFCVDDSRIYATGMSNGGGFVNTIACNEVGGKFAAFAPVAGSFYTDVDGTGCNPARKPLPMLEIHGVQDETVPYVGGEGEGGQLPPVLHWLGYWIWRNDCSGGAKDEDANGKKLTWDCAGKSNSLVHYKVEGMLHEWPMHWPTLSGIVAGDFDGTPIDANQIIMDFFDQWTL